MHAPGLPAATLPAATPSAGLLQHPHSCPPPFTGATPLLPMLLACPWQQLPLTCSRGVHRARLSDHQARGAAALAAVQPGRAHDEKALQPSTLSQLRRARRAASTAAAAAAKRKQAAAAARLCGAAAAARAGAAADDEGRGVGVRSR